MTTIEKQRFIEIRKKAKKYQKGYNILMCYFDSIADNEQEKVLKKLTKAGF